MNLQALYDVRVAEREAGTEIRALPRRSSPKVNRKTDQKRTI
jgi:hypothetical protein